MAERRSAVTVAAASLTICVIGFAAWSLTASVTLLLGTGLGLRGHTLLGAWWLYLLAYGTSYPPLNRWLALGALAGCVPLLLLLALVGRLLRREKEPLYGRADFATEEDLVAAGYRGSGKEQVALLGEKDGKPLRLKGQAHVAIIAPTGAGKGVSFVVPNALLWRGSLVALDMKKELWAKTAGARDAAGQRVYLFDPLDENGCTARWNPLAYVSRGSAETFSDIERIFEMLFPEAAGTSDPFWMNAPRLAAAGVTALVSETPGLPFTMGEVARTFTQENVKDYVTGLIQKRRAAGGAYSQPTIGAVNFYLNNHPGTFDSITSTVVSRLQLWLDPRVDAATAENDFDLRELRHRLYAVYVGVTRESLALLRPVLSLFFQQVVDVNSRATFEDDPDARHRVLLLLDEFANLDRMKVLSSAFSLVRGYGMRIMLVLQSRSQLPALYGEAEARSILSNCEAKVFFRPDDTAELRDLSERLGYNTVEGVSYTRPRWWLAGGGGQRRGETVSNQRRALRLPQEIARMSEQEVLIVHTGMPPLIARRIIYWKDKMLSALICQPPYVMPIKVTLQPARQPTAVKPPTPARKPPVRSPTAPKAAPDLPPVPAEEPEPAAKKLLSEIGGKPFDLTKYKTDPAAARALVEEVVSKVHLTRRGKRTTG